MSEKKLELSKLHQLEALSASVAQSLSNAQEAMEKINKAAQESAIILGRWVNAFEVVSQCED